MRGGLAVVAAGVLVCAPAAAEPRAWVPAKDAVAARLVAVGTWEFSASRRGPDGKPECYESWTFNADGTGRIISGKQRIDTRWTIDRYEGLGQFVFITSVVSTEGPDCLGRAVDVSSYPKGHTGFELLFFADGAGALVCFEGMDITRTDESRVAGRHPEDCWGRIVPAAAKDKRATSDQ